VAKVERRKTLRDTDRFKALQARLDRMVQDMHEIRAQIEASMTRDPLSILQNRWESVPPVAGDPPRLRSPRVRGKKHQAS
jgi:hypothetical protein